MIYVYILQSLAFDHFYVGITDSERQRRLLAQPIE